MFIVDNARDSLLAIVSLRLLLVYAVLLREFQLEMFGWPFSTS